MFNRIYIHKIIFLDGLGRKRSIHTHFKDLNFQKYFRILISYLLLPFCQIVTILNRNDGHINARVVICERFRRHIAYGPRHN